MWLVNDMNGEVAREWPIRPVGMSDGKVARTTESITVPAEEGVYTLHIDVDGAKIYVPDLVTQFVVVGKGADQDCFQRE